VDGNQTGCVSGGVFGEANSSATQGYVTIPGFSTFTLLNRNHSWVHFGFSGNQIFVLNSGSWSFGTPLGRGGVASNTPRAAQATGHRGVDNLDLMFDGYCDGMHLVNPSAGLGTAHSVDGNRTGCSNEALIGATTSVNNQAGTYVVTFVTGGLWVQTAIFPDHTWVHYSVTGNQIYVLNSGTWSNVIAGGTGRPSTG
jgi:hypothetical protein